MAGEYKAGENILSIVKGKPQKRFEPLLFGALMFADDEEEAFYESLRLSYHARYKPFGLAEEEYVDDLVEIVWRQRRMAELEMMLLERMCAMVRDDELPMPSLNTICRYKDQLDRNFKLTLKALSNLVDRRSTGDRPTGRDMPHPAELKWLTEQLAERDIDESGHEVPEDDQSALPTKPRPGLRLVED